MFITTEHLAYLALGLLSLVMHVWGLGDRALHHDETLHATYSWYIYIGRQYIHDPLLHGPFLYYLGALVYFLFGDNDFTARLGAALFGTVLTVLPFLVRRELGRPAALMASVYLLISPAFLYVGRFIRHDIYSIVFEMLVFVAIVRYASTHRPAWLYLGAAAFGLMFTNQETSYLFLLIMGTPLVLLLLWRVYKPGIPVLAGLAVALAALVFVLPGTAKVDGANNAVRNASTGLMEEYTPGPIFGWYPLETSDNNYALDIRNRADNRNGEPFLANLAGYAADLWKFFGHPAILIGMTLLLSSAGLLIGLIWFDRGRDGFTPWQRARARNDAVVDVYASLMSNWHWLGALAIFGLIYTLLFTAFLTNRLGIITGVTGSLLYWLAQHGVERGGQPDYYYLVLLFIYEPLLLFWGVIGLLLVTKDLLLSRRAPDRSSHTGAPGFTPLLLAWWSLGALGIYSWAGEKMPWLSIHVALPLVLLSAWACQRVLRRLWAPDADQPARLRFQGRRAALLFGTGFGVIMVLGFILMSIYVNADGQIGLPEALRQFFGLERLPGWVIPLVIMVLLGMLGVAAVIYQGWRWTVSMLALSLTLVGGVYTFRNAYRLTYLNGDVPREMLIYTQTSPDVMRVVRQVEEASRRRGGGLDMPIMYDNETIWLWYFRDFPNAVNTGQQLSGPPGPEIQAVFMLQENISGTPQNRTYLEEEGFRMQRLPLRWWFPEDDIYRLRGNWRTDPLDDVSLLARVLRAPLNSETVIHLWDFLIYRDTRAALGSTDFVLAVRPELADQISLGLGTDLYAREP